MNNLSQKTFIGSQLLALSIRTRGKIGIKIRLSKRYTSTIVKTRKRRSKKRSRNNNKRNYECKEKFKFFGKVNKIKDQCLATLKKTRMNFMKE